MVKKIVLSGYFGFENFGDEAILKTIVNALQNNVKDLELTIIAANPQKTKEQYSCKTLYTFDMQNIFRAISNCEVFISGGGSVLQDVTSLKSLLYYLFLIFFAKISGKKTILLAQGIGPVKSKLGKFFNAIDIKKLDLITVRDEKSFRMLDKWGVKCYLTADLIWSLDFPITERKESAPLQLGVQLREWKGLDLSAIKNIASAIKRAFDVENCEIKLIALQSKEDKAVCEQLMKELKNEKMSENIRLVCTDDIDENIKEIASLDYLIAMRFHAGLVAIRQSVPLLMLSYDPKVTTLCEEAKIPYLETSQIQEEFLIEKIEEVKSKKAAIVQNQQDFEMNMQEKSRQNISLLNEILKN